MGPRHDKPTWAGRVPREKVAQLYTTDAKGLVDKDLIEEVGIGFLVRIESIFEARVAGSGRARCPICRNEIVHDGNKHTILRCPPCNWELSWGAYQRTIRGKHLAAAGIGDFLRQYTEGYRRARTAKEKMVLIDTLIHRYHWELEGGLTRPGATDLIGGSQNEVLKFLNDLSYGENSTPEILQTRDEWIVKVKQSRQQWKEKTVARQEKKAERGRKKELKKKLRLRQLAEKAKSRES